MATLPGQTFVNGTSSLLMGLNTPPDYGAPTGFVVSSTVQNLVKQLGCTVMRITSGNGTTQYTDAQIDQRLTACKNAGCLPLMILGHDTGVTFAQHVVKYCGSRCNLYEVGNEPDLNPNIAGWQGYLSFWNSLVSACRPLNTSAAFGGPVLGVSPDNFNSYLQPWLAGTKTSGVLPDFVSFHQYPCGTQPTASVCQTKAASLGTSTATLRTLVQNTLGYNLPLALTEWAPDWNTTPVSYAWEDTPGNASFFNQWMASAFAGMVQNKLDMSCFWDCSGNAEGGHADIISTGGTPGAAYSAFQTAVTTYLGSGGGGSSTTTITASPSTLNFTATVGGSNPASQNVTLTNTGTVSGAWTISISYDVASGSNSWLTASQASGTLGAGASTTISLQAILGNLAAGTYTATVTYPNYGTTTQTITFTVSAAGGSVTALSLYYSNEASSTLATANKLYITGGSPATNATYTVIGTQTGYFAVAAQGNGSATTSGSIPSPSGVGFFLDSGTLNLAGKTIPAGNWNGIIRLNSSQNPPYTQAGTLSADIHVRVYKYNTNTAVYTLIGDMVLGTQTIPYPFTSFTLPNTSMSAVTFASGETLYLEPVVDATTNSNSGITTEGIRFNRLSTDTSTHTGDSQAIVVTPGYQSSGAANLTASPTTLSFAGIASTSDPVNTGSVVITNTTGSSGAWTSPITYHSGSGWLSCSPSSGTLAAGASQTVTVTASNLAGSLAAGTYTATITWTKGADTATTDVTLVVSASSTSIINASPSTLNFSAQVGVNPATQTITLTNTGSNAGTYTSNIVYTNSGSWLSLAPSTGTLTPGTPVSVVASVNASGLAVGTKSATITFTLGTTTATVSVTLFVSGTGAAHVLTNAGANLIAAGLSGADNPLVKYVAVGTGSNPPLVTDTKLQSESFRKAVTAYTPGTNPGEIIINGYIAPNEAVNVNIEEVGFFGGNSATSSPNTGVLIARGLYHVASKTALESISIPLDLTFPPG